MLKYLALLVLVLGLAFIVARHDETSTLQSAQESTPKDNSAIVGKANEDHTQKHPDDSAWDSPTGHIFHNAFRWPEGTTVWAIILTLLAIAEQTHQTRRSAKATEEAVKASRDSLKVQEAEFFQWLDIGDWEIEQLDKTKHGWSRSGTGIQNHPGPMNFRISFPLANNTPRPLFIHSVRTRLEIGSGKIEKKFLAEESRQVPPKSEYKVVIDTDFTQDNVTEWIAHAVAILGVVDVWFSNALGRKEETRFERLVLSRWGPDGETRTVGRGHKAEEVDKKAN